MLQRSFQKIIISTQRSNDPSNRKTLYKQVLRKDRKRVFSWFRDIKDRLSTCEIDDANCCEFKDEEGTVVKFVRCKNRVQEWCDGVTIIDKIERMTVDRDGGVILDQDDELIPISIADRDRVFGWIDRVFKELNVDMGYAKLVERDGSDVDLTNIVSQKRKSPGRFVISANRKKPTRRALIKGKDKEEEKKKKRVRSHGDDASAKRKKKKKKKKSTLPSFSTSNPKHLVGYVFQEIESEELFAILESLGERTLRYASLTPDPQEDENTFECTINKNALLMDRVRIVREATSEEMKKAIALWKREHPPQKKSGLLCSLFTDESSNANIEIEVEDGRMDIFRDRMIAVENVTNLIVNEKYVELLFERKALESQFHSHPLSFTREEKHSHTTKRTEPINHRRYGTILFVTKDTNQEILTKVRTSDRERIFKCLRQYTTLSSVAIEEMQNVEEMELSSEEEDEEEKMEKRKSWKGYIFEEKNSTSSTSELFVVFDQNEEMMKYASLTPVDGERNTFSVPNDDVLTDESIRLVRSATSEEMKFALDMWKKVQDNVEYEESKRLEFMDMDGTRMVFKVQEDKRLEEWCDGKIEINSVQDIRIDRENGTIRDDAGEIIPIKRADRERVFEWILNTMRKLNLGIQDTIEFVDADESHVRFLVRCGDRLEEWCDDKCVIEDVRSLSLDRDGGVLRDDEGDLIPIRKDDRNRVFDWIIDTSRKISRLDLGYVVFECFFFHIRML